MMTSQWIPSSNLKVRVVQLHQEYVDKNSNKPFVICEKTKAHLLTNDLEEIWAMYTKMKRKSLILVSRVCESNNLQENIVYNNLPVGGLILKIVDDYIRKYYWMDVVKCRFMSNGDIN